MIRRLSALLGLLALIAVPAAGAHAGIQDFTVVNNGSTAVWYIYVVPNYAEDWEEDVLGDDVLMPGNQIDITMNGYGDHCYFDLLIQDSEGAYQEYYDVNLCVESVVTFAAQAPAAASKTTTGGSQELTVINNGSAAVWYIFISPNYSDSWEEDVLGDDVLMSGQQTTVTLSGYGDHCWFDVKVEDSNGKAREYYDVDVCNTYSISFP